MPGPQPAPPQDSKPLDGVVVVTCGTVRLVKPPPYPPLGVPESTAAPAGMLGSRICAIAAVVANINAQATAAAAETLLIAISSCFSGLTAGASLRFIHALHGCAIAAAPLFRERNLGCRLSSRDAPVGMRKKRRSHARQGLHLRLQLENLHMTERNDRACLAAIVALSGVFACLAAGTFFAGSTTAFAQAGSTGGSIDDTIGGTIGETDKPVSSRIPRRRAALHSTEHGRRPRSPRPARAASVEPSRSRAAACSRTGSADILAPAARLKASIISRAILLRGPDSFPATKPQANGAGMTAVSEAGRQFGNSRAGPNWRLTGPRRPAMIPHSAKRLMAPEQEAISHASDLIYQNYLETIFGQGQHKGQQNSSLDPPRSAAIGAAAQPFSACMRPRSNIGEASAAA